MDLKNARIIGFFSLPSPSLGEHNPAAYCNAMANVPAGAGSCSHCGNGIIHHVVVRDSAGTVRFIGTTCAEKIGVDREALRYRMTSEEREARAMKRAERAAAFNAMESEWDEHFNAYLAQRLEKVGHVVEILESKDSDFHRSLATQLRQGSLSPNQAFYAAKATSATGRRNKKNAEAWDAIYDICVEQDGRPSYYEFCRAWRESNSSAA